jgi:hypothetical protein
VLAYLQLSHPVFWDIWDLYGTGLHTANSVRDSLVAPGILYKMIDVSSWSTFSGSVVVSGRHRRGRQRQARQEQEVPRLPVEPGEARRQAEDAGAQMSLWKNRPRCSQTHPPIVKINT